MNDMSLRAREDAVNLNKEEVADAEKRLERAQMAMLDFRDKQSVVDAAKEADARIDLVAKTRSISRKLMQRSRGCAPT